eukprot:TRINITY_DN11170_c0_g2_i9.p1 TRINITY_DN11170_c0_g2~~TRINITY_DN11170_c0_g2_i9.p1  ORF type:complete len:140 (-),score=26.02 TRINITY_DN11170_c0_g2_i9:1558-1977(-)
MKSFSPESPVDTHKRQQPQSPLSLFQVNNKPFKKALNFHKVFSYKTPTLRMHNGALTKRSTMAEDSGTSLNYSSSNSEGRFSRVGTEGVVSMKKLKHLIPQIIRKSNCFRTSPKKCKPSNSTIDNLNRVKVIVGYKELA